MNLPEKHNLALAKLSFRQKYIWRNFCNKEGVIDPIISFSYHVNGKLNIKKLKKALANLLDRHNILKLSVCNDNDEVFSYYKNPKSITINIIHLENVAKNEQNTLIAQYDDSEPRKPINLSYDLPIRITILKLAQTKCIIYTSIHHLIADGHSARILMRELFSHYFDETLISTTKPKQFEDYVQQCTYNPNDILKAAWWIKQLTAPKLQEKTVQDEIEYKTQNIHSQNQQIALCKKNYSLLKKHSLPSGFAMALLSMGLTLCHELDQKNITICFPFLGDRTNGHHETIGLFAVLIPICIDINYDSTFISELKHFSKRILDAYDYANMNDVTRTRVIALYNTNYANYVFQYHNKNTSEAIAKKADIQCDFRKFHTISSSIDIYFSLNEISDHQFNAYSYFRAGLYQPKEGQQLITKIITNFKQFIRHPNKHISEVLK